MMKRKKNLPNSITAVRILCSLALLFVRPFSVVFYVLYLTAGLSDVLDGFVARKTGSVSEFGSVMDTAADFILVAVCLIRFLPIMDIPLWLGFWAAVIALIKVITLFTFLSRHHKAGVAHTVFNKAVGILLFLLPLSLKMVDIRFSGIVVSIAATLAALEERKILLEEDPGESENPVRER